MDLQNVPHSKTLVRGVPHGLHAGSCSFQCGHQLPSLLPTTISLVLPVYVMSGREIPSWVASLLPQLSVWYSGSGMQLHAQKTCILFICHHPCQSHVLYSDPLCVLGVLFDKALSFLPQWDFLVAKINSFAYLFRWLRSMAAHQKLVIIFRVKVQALLAYSAPFLVGLPALHTTMCCMPSFISL